MGISVWYVSAGVYSHSKINNKAGQSLRDQLETKQPRGDFKTNPELPNNCNVLFNELF